MTTIDEIMAAVVESQDAAVAYEAEAITAEQIDGLNDALRDMIAAALADAERRGAEAMRTAAAHVGFNAAFSEENGCDVMDAVMALPLPTRSQS
jgi:hypothetical protein